METFKKHLTLVLEKDYYDGGYMIYAEEHPDIVAGGRDKHSAMANLFTRLVEKYSYPLTDEDMRHISICLTMKNKKPKTAKQIARKYVYGCHDALTDAQEIADLEREIVDYAERRLIAVNKESECPDCGGAVSATYYCNECEKGW